MPCHLVIFSFGFGIYFAVLLKIAKHWFLSVKDMGDYPTQGRKQTILDYAKDAQP